MSVNPRLPVYGPTRWARSPAHDDTAAVHAHDARRAATVGTADPVVRAFGGIRPVLHLPFRDGPDQPIDHAALRRLVELVVASDVDGVVVMGLASEAWTIREAERSEVLATVAETLDHRVPLVVGVDGATALARARAREAVTFGAVGLMVLPPTGATGNRLAAHFAAIADAGGVPIVVQDSPQITGVTLTADAVLALGRAHPLVVALKVEVGGAGAKISAVAAGGMAIVAGWGGLQYLESIRRGAIGCFPGCDLAPALLAIDRAARAGHADEADARYRTILPYLAYVAQSLDLLLLGAKRLLRRQGIFRSEALRSPARGLDAEEAATLDTLYVRLAADGVPGFEDVQP